MEPETCENVFKIPHVFYCAGGCCGYRLEQYCCTGDESINLTVFVVCSVVLFVLVSAWCWKKAKDLCTGSNRKVANRTRTVLQDYNLEENRIKFGPVPDSETFISPVSVHFGNKMGSKKKTKRTIHTPINYQLRSLGNRETPPTYEEAIRIK